MRQQAAVIIFTNNPRTILGIALTMCMEQPAQHFFVFHNASTDGTREYLDEQATSER